MDTRTQPTLDRVYEDFEPYYEWAKDEGSFTFMLPGFRRDQLKVQVTSKPTLKLTGERQIIGNRWRRFALEFPIPSDYDLEKVRGKFEFGGSKLHIKFAKLVKPMEPTTNPPEEASSRPKEPSQNVDKQNAAQEVTPRAKEEKAEARTNDKLTDQKIPQKEKEPSDEKEENKTEAAATIDKAAQGKDKTNNGISETTEAPENKDAKQITRFKTRILDFTQSLGPSNQVYNEELGDLDAGTNTQKKLVNCGLLTLLVVGIGLCAKSVFTSSHGGSKFQDQ